MSSVKTQLSLKKSDISISKHRSEKAYIDTIYRAREDFPPLFYFFSLSHSLAHGRTTFVAMTTFYCPSLEDALKRAKAAGKRPGCHYGGIILPSGRRGFAVYKDGKVVERYSYCLFPRRDGSASESATIHL